MHANATKGRMFKVLVPIEKKDGSTFWMRVGSGFPGKDPATINIFMDAFPVNQKMLHLREMDEEDFQPRKDRRGEASAPPSNPARSEDLPF